MQGDGGRGVSFADRPRLTMWQKLGCLIGFGFAFVVFCGFMWLVGFPLLMGAR